LGIIGAIIIWAAYNPPAPQKPTAVEPRARPLAATAPTPHPPRPDDIVKAHAPQSEIDLANAHLAFREDVVAPNAIVREELQKQKSRVWQQAVLKIGTFNEWAGIVSDIRSDARITIDLPSRLRVWGDVKPNSTLFSTIRAMSDKSTPVLFSGHINKRSIDITADNNDDDVFPTCFEDAFGISGCEIDLTSLRVIP
jgi:hypothetical protein